MMLFKFDLRVLFYSVFAFLSIHCNNKNSQQVDKMTNSGNELSILFKERANKFSGFSFDSLEFKSDTFCIYVTDTISYLTLLPFIQKLDYMFQDLVYKPYTLPGQVSITLHLPNREGDKFFPYYFSTLDLLKALEKYKDECFRKTIDLLVKINNQDITSRKINTINLMLGYYQYKEKMIDKAFEGVDSYVYFLGYIMENRANQDGSNHVLMDSLYLNLGSSDPLKNDIEQLLLLMDDCS